MYFGLGSTQQVDKVVVRLANGTTKEFDSFATDQVHVIHLPASR